MSFRNSAFDSASMQQRYHSTLPMGGAQLQHFFA